MHASLVASQFTLFPMTLAGITAVTSLLVWAAVLWTVVAAVILTNGGQLAQQQQPKGMG